MSRVRARVSYIRYLNMDATQVLLVAISVALVAVASPFYRALNWLWLKPKKLEKYLKEQGSRGNAYRVFLGDMGEYASMVKQEQPKEIKLSDNVSLHGLPHSHHTINKFVTAMVRYIPTKENKRMKQVCEELQALLSGIITKRAKAMETEASKHDLHGILMKSNSTEIKEQGIGLSIQEVIDECQVFFFAGSDTTSNLLVCTMISLGLHPEWQTRAREEVLQVLDRTPDFDGLNRLKIVTMILQEVLRL